MNNISNSCAMVFLVLGRQRVMCTVGEKPTIRLQLGPYQHASEVDCSGASVDDDCIKTSDTETPDLG